MPLQAGARLGPYEILALIGAGGMGEVYRATDTNLKRQVAIKVLPRAMADDPERLARFQREAEVLAALNHPHIAHIYGLERSDGTTALVMELVEGPTLADRLVRGPMPLDEALPIARQIAEALEAAHEQGIIHRDLKPANVKVRPDGTVKMLDFGLAKLSEAGGAGQAGGAGPNASMSPTLSIAATQAGIILGTAAYMAPEQAAGKIVDRRADIWSFGVVLWEMLTGRRLFDGETVSHTLADVLRAPIDFDALPSSTPRAVRELVTRCLDRDVATRLRDIGEARIAIQRCLSQPPGEAVATATTKPLARRSSGVMSLASVAVAAVFALAFGAVAFVHFRETAAPPRVISSQILPPDGMEFNFQRSLALPALSPDGTRVVFGAETADGKTQLYVRRLDQQAAQPLQGTDDAVFPFWSPDSRWVGFGQAGSPGKLKKIDIQGGPPATITDLQGAFRGGSWNAQGVIIFGTNNGTSIRRVSASGGMPEPVTAESKADSGTYIPLASPSYPRFLPDGRHFLYTTRQGGDIPVRVGSLDKPGQAGTIVAKAQSNVEYADGYLLYLRESTLMAQPFDVRRLETTGEAVSLAEGVPTFVQPSRSAGFTAASGLLVVQEGYGDRFRLVWRDRQGKDLGTFGEVAGRAGDLKFSPDGSRLATRFFNAGNVDIWIYDVARGAPSRFTFAPAPDMSPVWSPDGNTLYYSSGSTTGPDIYRKASNGSSSEELLLADALAKNANVVTPDGKSLVFSRLAKEGGRDLWVLPLTAPSSGARGEPRVILQTPFDETLADVSPDGKWLIYQSTETGAFEVYAMPFPGGGGKRQISTAGGLDPIWRRDGREIFYRSGTFQMMAVSVTDRNGTLEIGQPQVLFGGLPQESGMFAPAPDGQRFLVSENAATSQIARGLTLVANWTALKRTR